LSHLPIATKIAPIAAVVTTRSRQRFRRPRLRVAAAEAGMSTAEYAVGTLAACGFAGVLWVVVHSDAVHGLLQSVVERALNLAP
jgi:Protein of unknown function (DUF4244)